MNGWPDDEVLDKKCPQGRLILAGDDGREDPELNKLREGGPTLPPLTIWLMRLLLLLSFIWFSLVDGPDDELNDEFSLFDRWSVLTIVLSFECGEDVVADGEAEDEGEADDEEGEADDEGEDPVDRIDEEEDGEAFEWRGDDDWWWTLGPAPACCVSLLLLPFCISWDTFPLARLVQVEVPILLLPLLQLELPLEPLFELPLLLAIQESTFLANFEWESTLGVIMGWDDFAGEKWPGGMVEPAILATAGCEAWLGALGMDVGLGGRMAGRE